MQSFTAWFQSVAWLEVFKAVSGLLVGLGWPAAIVFIAVLFRAEIRKKFADIQSAGPGGVMFRVQDIETLEDLKQLKQDSSTLSAAQRAVEEPIMKDLEAIQPDRRVPILVKQLVIARLARHFEGTYAVIFGSQLTGLRRLRDYGGQTSLEQAEQFFNEAKTAHADFYQSISFEDWFRFLKNSGLADLKGGSVTITDLGREFLTYVDEVKSNFSPKPF